MHSPVQEPALHGRGDAVDEGKWPVIAQKKDLRAVAQE
jgi:hypothetical protein